VVARPTPIPDDATFRAFLLGLVDDRERTKVEEQLFADAGVHERLLEIEEELTEAYVQRQLSADERDRFELQYLSTPEGRQRIAITSAGLSALGTLLPAHSNRRVRRSPPRAWLAWLQAGSGGWRLATSAAAVAVAAIVLVWNQDRFWRNRLAETTDQLARLQQVKQDLRRQADEARGRVDRLAQELARHRSARVLPEPSSLAAGSLAPIVSLSLTPGLSRGAIDEAARLSLPRNASVVVLRLAVDNVRPGQPLRVILRDAADAEAWRQDLTTPHPWSTTEMLALSIPAARLDFGEYLLTLQGRRGQGGFENIATYAFVVARQP